MSGKIFDCDRCQFQQNKSLLDHFYRLSRWKKKQPPILLFNPEHRAKQKQKEKNRMFLSLALQNNWKEKNYQLCMHTGCCLIYNGIQNRYVTYTLSSNSTLERVDLMCKKKKYIYTHIRRAHVNLNEWTRALSMEIKTKKCASVTSMN